MKIKWSPSHERSLQKFDKNMRLKVKKKLKIFVENKRHPSLRYKKVKALKHERPSVWEISVDMVYKDHFTRVR